MAHCGRYLVFPIILALALPLAAQQPAQDDRLQQLEKRLDELIRQSTELRQEIDRLKGAQPQPQPQPAAEEDLTKIGVVTPPQAPTAQPQPPPPALTEVQTISNVINPAASKVFNPDISVIGNFIGKAGQPNAIEFGGEERRSAQLDEAEVAFQAFVDPYAKANFFVSVTPEGIEVEEGYAQFVALPYDLTAKAGKFKALFGKDNTWHTHVRPWIDQPLMIHNLFGDEGMADSGVSLSKVFPNRFVFVEGTAEVFSGNVEGVFRRASQNDLFYNAHLKAFKDITENNNIEVGTSYARGNLAGRELEPLSERNEFGGIDVTYRWKPLQRGLYNSFIARFEGVANRRGDFRDRLYGFYTSADYQLSRRWFTGVRLDRANRVASDLITDRGISGTITFWPSEFSQLRGQFRRTRYGAARTVNEFLFQVQFAIGAHGAHTF